METYNISVGQGKTVVTPLLTDWSYNGLALSYVYDLFRKQLPVDILWLISGTPLMKNIAGGNADVGLDFSLSAQTYDLYRTSLYISVVSLYLINYVIILANI